MSAKSLFVRFAVPPDRAAEIKVGLPVRVQMGNGALLRGVVAKVAPASPPVAMPSRLPTGVPME